MPRRAVITPEQPAAGDHKKAGDTDGGQNDLEKVTEIMEPGRRIRRHLNLAVDADNPQNQQTAADVHSLRSGFIDAPRNGSIDFHAQITPKTIPHNIARSVSMYNAARQFHASHLLSSATP